MTRYSDRQEGLATLKTIDLNRKDYLLIHYSCESFYNKEDGKSPRITSIAVRKFDDGQTDLFAIHKTAEIKGIPFSEIENNYDEIEKAMLDKFFQFVQPNSGKKWIHWNMRDTNYGFKAIEHRYEVLGGFPTRIDDQNKIDLSRLFIHLYGKRYIGNPRMIKLMEYNQINQKDFLNGQEEAEAFANRNYIKLSMSTASKVDLFSNYLTQAIDKKLMVLTKKWELNGTSIIGKWYSFKETIFYKPLVLIVNIIIGIVLERFFISRFF
ncbi:hypothetical protein [Enterococcus sp. JM9B]|uniref:hypothetical protein n=1 Tax=Enterococcus sp. JM9B TaxID=1857216 RepID=UPI001374DDFF|nr:hypothetical protein [Enterococcus sp. JM9B]KAF1303703.1 hypothetical protein BAU16_03820 [Enterococcus sp. JM9B]